MLLTFLQLLHINFGQGENDVFISHPLINAEPKFDVISGGLTECLAEPLRIAELTAGAGRSTATPIPKWVIDIQFVLVL